MYRIYKIFRVAVVELRLNKAVLKVIAVYDVQRLFLKLSHVLGVKLGKGRFSASARPEYENNF